jgi:hypothetical protein
VIGNGRVDATLTCQVRVVAVLSEPVGFLVRGLNVAGVRAKFGVLVVQQDVRLPLPRAVLVKPSVGAVTYVLDVEALRLKPLGIPLEGWDRGYVLRRRRRCGMHGRRLGRSRSTVVPAVQAIACLRLPRPRVPGKGIEGNQVQVVVDSSKEHDRSDGLGGDRRHAPH